MIAFFDTFEVATKVGNFIVGNPWHLIKTQIAFFSYWRLSLLPPFALNPEEKGRNKEKKEETRKVHIVNVVSLTL